MERRLFNPEPGLSPRILVKAFPFIICWLLAWLVIAYETAGLVRIVLMLVSFIFFSALCLFIDMRHGTAELRMSPCPTCGHSPMRFERSSKGDYVFICDKCQIEWKLDPVVFGGADDADAA
jgi:hypothetical protein